jgi:hypothetical protein
VTLIITIKKVSTRIHQKCTREFMKVVHDNSPFVSTKILPPNFETIHTGKFY